MSTTTIAHPTQRRRKTDVILIVAVAYLSLCMLAALGAGLLTEDTMELSNRLTAPDAAHWLGTDGLGRDVLSRVIAGAQASLSVAVSVVMITSSIGLLVGAWLGLAGGRIESMGTTLIDMFMSFPGLLLALALTAVLGPSRINVIFALSILGWTGYARLARGQTLALRRQAFVESAVLSGSGRLRLAVLHVLPNILPLAMVEMTFGLAGAVLAESTLSFLGLSDPTAPSWGAMLNEGVDQMNLAPHLTWAPGLMLSLFVLSVNLIGDELQVRLSPELRNKRG